MTSCTWLNHPGLAPIPPFLHNIIVKKWRRERPGNKATVAINFPFLPLPYLNYSIMYVSVELFLVIFIVATPTWIHSHNWFHTDYNIVICYESYLSVMHSCFFGVFFCSYRQLINLGLSSRFRFWLDMRKVWDQRCFKSDIIHCSCKDGGTSVSPISNDILAVSSMVINFVVQILWQNVQAISACFALAKQLACNSDNNRVVTWVTSCMSITSAGTRIPIIDYQSNIILA